MLKFVIGDIVKGDYTIFCQQVNCRHKMGSGLARQIRNKYPEVYAEYMNVENQTLGYILPVATHDGRVCINMFAQENYGRDGKCYTNYDAFNKCLKGIIGFINEHHIKENTKIAFPSAIGCGLGGGDWNIIKEILKDFSNQIPQDVYIVSLG